MPSDFDTTFNRTWDRRDTWATKWERYVERDVLPFWVADMEFPSPPEVTAALQARVAHGIFGYTNVSDTLRQQVIEHLARDHGWHVQPDWLLWLPGVVPGLNVACRAIGEPGDGIVTAVPIYHPFLEAPANAHRRRLDAHLARHGQRFEMDLDRLETDIDAHTRGFLLCNPQNPTGRVYTRAELLELAAFAERHDLILVSDEIHAGLVLEPDCRHLPMASLAPEIARRTITLMAPTKTYNMPGLGCAFAVIPDADLRRRFKAAGNGFLAHVGPLAITAAEAAYRHGGPWLEALLQRLRANRDRLQAAVDTMAGLTMTPVEATCLAWIDARGLDVADPHRFFEDAGVGLSPGAQFGSPGFVRFNFGCAPAMLEEGIRRMQAALAKAPIKRCGS
ncbi:MAG: PatB family C-S lyase [Gammaproteobacteria bacterium]|nr:PatB family C-S lyase [Gammaproteobacteria bacterium]